MLSCTSYLILLLRKEAYDMAFIATFFISQALWNCLIMKMIIIVVNNNSSSSNNNNNNSSSSINTNNNNNKRKKNNLSQSQAQILICII
jgi:hypothetical protein